MLSTLGGERCGHIGGRHLCFLWGYLRVTRPAAARTCRPPAAPRGTPAAEGRASLRGKWQAAILVPASASFFRRAIDEDARARPGCALLRLFLLRGVGCSPDGSGSGFGLCVLHEPDASDHHREQDRAGDEEPHCHALSAPQCSVESADREN